MDNAIKIILNLCKVQGIAPIFFINFVGKINGNNENRDYCCDGQRVCATEEGVWKRPQRCAAKMRHR